MPTYRKLYVKSCESLDINAMPDDFTRLLWVMMPLGLDRDGKGVDNAAWLKAKIMPLREDVTLIQIGNAMNWYEQRGMIRRYSVEGRQYFMVRSWKRYQTGTDREAESNYPDPVDISQEQLVSNSGVTHDKELSNTGVAPAVVKHAASASAYESESVNASESANIVPNSFQVFEANIGALTPMIAEKLKAADQEYSPGWVKSAIDEAVIHEVRNWSYIEAILRRWKVEGLGSSHKTRPGGNGHSPGKGEMIDLQKIIKESML